MVGCLRGREIEVAVLCGWFEREGGMIVMFSRACGRRFVERWEFLNKAALSDL